MLRIIIADDHEMVRRGVRDVIEAHPDWEVCGEAADGQAAVELALREHPDIAIVDISMPGLNGLAVTRQLQASCPGTSVLIFTFHDDEETVHAGMAAGARGYLLKTDSTQNLEAAISALGARRPYFSPLVSEHLLQAALYGSRRSQLENFTLRELEIGQLIADGQSNKQIARRLERSLKTIESHRAAIMRKANVRSAAGFVRFAIKNNLIQA